MKLSIIETGFFKLDGGAMFGVVPRSMWTRLNPPDDNSLCTWAMRCLLIETGDRKILIDTGIGNKQSDKFRSHFEPHGDHSLTGSLSDSGLSHEDITDVFLTHFHFDHVGGAVISNEGKLTPNFPNAKYWTSKQHFDWALDPNPREKASFLKENFVPLAEEGILHFIKEEQGIEWMPNINIRFSYCHTEAMMIPEIKLPNGNRIFYCADLLPSTFHARMPYVMAYDIRPLVTLAEKKSFYEEVEDEKTFLFFEHDPLHAIGQLKRDARNRFTINTDASFEDIIS